MKKSTFIYFVVIVSIVFLGVNIQKVIPTVQGIIRSIRGEDNKQRYQEVKWQDIKGQLSSNEISADALNLVNRVYLKDNEIDEALDIYNSSKSADLRKSLFIANSNLKRNT